LIKLHMSTFESRLSVALGKGGAETVYLAAVSGGADSTAMLTGLAALRKEAGFTLHCVHMEHGIRLAEESLGDALAVEALCEKLDIPCRIVSVPPGRIAAFAGNGGPGIECAARIFRHKAFAAERRRVKADWVLTAHTCDDLLETLLMRVLQGSGPAGLAPMPSTRGRMLRPLLGFTRQDVLEYLEEKDILYRTDSTNNDIRFLRNRVRHKLVPFLDSFFPSWGNSLLTLAETQSLTAEFLASEVRKRLHWESSCGSLRLKEEDFMKAPPILREEAIFAGVDMLMDSGFQNGKNRQPRRAAIRAAASGGTGDLGPVRLERQSGFLTLSPCRRSQGERGFSLLINEPGFYTLKGRGKKEKLCVRAGEKSASGNAGPSIPLAVAPHAAFHAAFHAQFPLVLKNHQDGDLIQRGGHKRRFSDIINTSARSRYSEIITACDAGGTAAFIAVGEGLMVVKREDKAGVSDSSFFEIALGDMNA
jgi:tRNA(Ile)-lysidine synthase